jgi:hypothetical protein
MLLYRNNEKKGSMKPLIYSIFATLFAFPSFAADGPENSGSFTIESPTDKKFEANLQIDRKILKHFDSDFISLLAVGSSGTPCESTKSAAIENPDVLTASLVYVCPEGTDILDLSLQALNSLPDDFTMGVRTAIDHFVLTKEAPNAKTILKPEFAFGLAGLTLFLDHPIREKAHIGRPHAFYYGGLSALPTGFYFLLLAAALWLTNLSIKTKWLASVAALPLAVAVTVFVINKQATLSILPVKVLGILFLTLTAGILLCSFSKAGWSTFLAALFLVTGIALTGVEFAVMLRWLEGQETLNKSLIVGSFYVGLAVPCFIIVTVATSAVFYIQKGRVVTGFPQKTKSVSIVLVLLGTIYSLSALLVKLP